LTYSADVSVTGPISTGDCTGFTAHHVGRLTGRDGSYISFDMEDRVCEIPVGSNQYIAHGSFTLSPGSHRFSTIAGSGTVVCIVNFNDLSFTMQFDGTYTE